MKIFAQSTVAPKLSYIHLGYTAATRVSPHKASLVSGLIMTVVGVAILANFMLKSVSSTKLDKARQWRRVKLGITGLVLILMGIAALVVSNKLGIEEYIDPDWVTRGNMRSLVTDYEMECYSAEKKQLPQLTFKKYIEELKNNQNSRHFQRLKDAWGSPILIKVLKEGPEYVIRMDSAGPDKIFGTLDDLISKYTYEGKERGMKTEIITPPLPKLSLKGKKVTI